MWSIATLIFDAFFILGTTIILVLLVFLRLMKSKAKVFYFNKFMLRNHLKNSPITEEMYFFLKQLASEGMVHNTFLLKFFNQNDVDKLDSVIKRKNKMINTFLKLQVHVFSTTIVKKIKDPNDHRQVIYILSKPYILKEIK